ncbi:MAG: terminase small subunit [Methylocystis sp.]|uniref:terminase small subunit n=1 Tax=Methylocystis sp. TaxID=1911079 RepID=UPI003DA5D5E3
MSAAAETSTRALTTRQRRFAEHYAMSGNGAESARLAGYAYKIARISAQEVLSNPNVVALVDELRKERLEQLGVRPDRVLEELAASAFVDPKDVFDENDDLLPVRRMPKVTRRAIKKIRIREHYDKKTGEPIGRDVDIEFNDKLRANEILGRHLGILKEQPIQVNQQNVFAAIVERAQGTALQPISQRDDDDSANTIEGEIIEKTDAPTTNMASGDALAAFNAIDGDEAEGEDDAEVQATDEADAERMTSERERSAFRPLWRRRRR